MHSVSIIIIIIVITIIVIIIIITIIIVILILIIQFLLHHHCYDCSLLKESCWRLLAARMWPGPCPQASRRIPCLGFTPRTPRGANTGRIRV